MQYGSPFPGTPALLDLLVNERQPQEHPYFLLISGGVGTGKPVYLRMLKDAGVIDENVAVIEPRSFLTLNAETQFLFPEIAKHAKIQHPEKLPHLIDDYYATVRALVEGVSKKGLPIVLMDHGENLYFIRDLLKQVRNEGYETHQVLMTCTRASYTNTTQGRANNPDIDRATDDERFLKQHQQISEQHDKLVRMFGHTIVTFKDVKEAPDLEKGGTKLEGLPPVVISRVEEKVIDGDAYEKYRNEDWSIGREAAKAGVDQGTVGSPGAAGNGTGKNGNGSGQSGIKGQLSSIGDNLPDLFKAREAKDKQDRKDKKL